MGAKTRWFVKVPKICYMYEEVSAVTEEEAKEECFEMFGNWPIEVKHCSEVESDDGPNFPHTLDYEDYIALSRYSRFRDDLGRRETWPETVDRLIDWWK